MGRACPLCPGTSDINLFCCCRSVIHFDAEISDRAFDFGVTEQQLRGSQVTIAPGNWRCFRPPERVGAEEQLTSLLGRLETGTAGSDLRTTGSEVCCLVIFAARYFDFAAG
jgi:hypothetical protein